MSRSGRPSAVAPLPLHLISENTQPTTPRSAGASDNLDIPRTNTNLQPYSPHGANNSSMVNSLDLLSERNDHDLSSYLENFSRGPSFPSVRTTTQTSSNRLLDSSRIDSPFSKSHSPRYNPMAIMPSPRRSSTLCDSPLAESNLDVDGGQFKSTPRIYDIPEFIILFAEYHQKAKYPIVLQLESYVRNNILNFPSESDLAKKARKDKDHLVALVNIASQALKEECYCYFWKAKPPLLSEIEIEFCKLIADSKPSNPKHIRDAILCLIQKQCEAIRAEKTDEINKQFSPDKPNPVSIVIVKP